MRIAIPLANGRLCTHFGHCEAFGIYDVMNNSIVEERIFNPPPHEPGLYPRLLGEMKVNVIISGGMGMNAQNLFANNNIAVVTGAQSDLPKNIINSYLNGTLKCGANLCDH